MNTFGGTSIGATSGLPIRTPLTRDQQTLGATPAAAPTSGLSPLFQKYFRSSLGGVLTDIVNGRFENQALSAEAKALQKTLRQAAAGVAALGDTSSAPAADARSGAGAYAAPVGSASTTAGQQRRLLEIHVRQARERTHKVAASVQERFPLGTQLKSLAAVAVDPEKIQPRDETEAQAVAQRLVIDIAVQGSELDVLASELGLAQFEARQGSAQARAQVAQLAERYQQQAQIVIGLAEAADRIAGIDLATAPNARGALAADKAAAGRMVAEAVRSGISHEDLGQLKAVASGLMEEARTGSSTLLDTVRKQLVRTLLSPLRQQRMAEDRRRAAKRRELDDKRADAKAYERRQDFLAALERASQRRAELDAQMRSAPRRT